MVLAPNLAVAWPMELSITFQDNYFHCIMFPLENEGKLGCVQTKLTWEQIENRLFMNSSYGM